jgi:hypothetical protein
LREEIGEHGFRHGKRLCHGKIRRSSLGERILALCSGSQNAAQD